jgi:predicted transcriptional regulator
MVRGFIGREYRFRLPPDLVERLDAVAQQEALTRAELVRTALENELARRHPGRPNPLHRGRRQPSAGSLAEPPGLSAAAYGVIRALGLKVKQTYGLNYRLLDSATEAQVIPAVVGSWVEHWKLDQVLCSTPRPRWHPAAPDWRNDQNRPAANRFPILVRAAEAEGGGGDSVWLCWESLADYVVADLDRAIRGTTSSDRYVTAVERSAPADRLAAAEREAWLRLIQGKIEGFPA